MPLITSFHCWGLPLEVTTRSCDEVQSTREERRVFLYLQFLAGATAIASPGFTSSSEKSMGSGHEGRQVDSELRMHALDDGPPKGLRKFRRVGRQPRHFDSDKPVRIRGSMLGQGARGHQQCR